MIGMPISHWDVCLRPHSYLLLGDYSPVASGTIHLKEEDTLFSKEEAL